MIYRLWLSAPCRVGQHCGAYVKSSVYVLFKYYNMFFLKYSFCRHECNNQWICANLGPWCSSRWHIFGDSYFSDRNCPSSCLHILEEQKRVQDGQNQWSEQKRIP